MILIDCGNSALKAQYLEQGRVQASYACRYDANWVDDFNRWSEKIPTAKACFASVLDRERQARLETCLRARFGDMLIHCRSAAAALGVENAYARPERLGVDRWLALLGAAEPGARDCFVIDAGSAITLDLLRADGRHLGGAILPGVGTSRERFRQIFAHIDFAEVERADHERPGCSTETAIQLDYAQDPLGHLHRLVKRWRPLLTAKAEILLTGGDSAAAQRELGPRARIVPDLVFRGMARLAQS